MNTGPGYSHRRNQSSQDRVQLSVHYDGAQGVVPTEKDLSQSSLPHPKLLTEKEARMEEVLLESLKLPTFFMLTKTQTREGYSRPRCNELLDQMIPLLDSQESVEQALKHIVIARYGTHTLCRALRWSSWEGTQNKVEELLTSVALDPKFNSDNSGYAFIPRAVDPTTERGVSKLVWALDNVKMGKASDFIFRREIFLSLAESGLTSALDELMNRYFDPGSKKDRPFIVKALRLGFSRETRSEFERLEKLSNFELALTIARREGASGFQLIKECFKLLKNRSSGLYERRRELNFLLTPTDEQVYSPPAEKDDSVLAFRPRS